MKDKKILIGTSLVLLLLLTTGLSYAYFSTAVKGNDNAKDMVVEAGTLKLTYTDGPAINVQNIKPGWTTTKTVSVKNNGTLDTAYNIVWQELTNTILKNELVISATCKKLNASGTVEGTCEPITELPVRAKRIAKNISIESGFTHEYTFTFLFKETNESQNYNQGKQFNGVLGIEEYKDTSVYCTYDGELTQGATFTKGDFTYKYKQQGLRYYNGDEYAFMWHNMNEDGWGVAVTDRNLTNSISTTDVCTYINNKPIISMSAMFAFSQSSNLDLSKLNTENIIDMSYMFADSQSTTLDLSSFDTSNVTNMAGMFTNSSATEINLSNLNTSKVTQIYGMFFNSQVTVLDLSNFDISRVTDMSNMFSSSQATTLDLSSFNTTNVNNMSNMFNESQATTLDLSNFDTSNVTNMGSMFFDSQATTLDLSNFDTSKVTDMNSMFSGSQATTLDLSSFNTTNVTDMSVMFFDSQATVLDLSNFDTSKVIEMNNMFSNSANLKTIYASDKFKTDKFTDSAYMFKNCTSLVGGAGTVYDANHADKTYARIDGGEASPGYFTAK